MEPLTSNLETLETLEIPEKGNRLWTVQNYTETENFRYSFVQSVVAFYTYFLRPEKR